MTALQGKAQLPAPLSYRDLPGSVRAFLAAMGRRWEAQGVTLLLFGSFARGDARSTSDLDILFEAPPGRDACTEVQLSRELDEMPSVRPVEIVNGRTADPGFRKICEREGVPLASLG